MKHAGSIRNWGATFRGIVAVFVTMLGLLLSSSTMCIAQLSTTGTINGTVVDSSGAVLPGAAVTIINLETKTITQAVTNSDGRFSQVGLNSGTYTVKVSSAGFDSYAQSGIYLEPTGTYTVNAHLKPGSVSTTVTVSGNAVQVQTTTPEVSSTVSGEEMEDLPLNGRNYQGLGSLMPGVVNTSPMSQLGTGGYLTNNTLSVNGSGTGGSLYTVDGIWNYDSGEHNQNTVVPNPDAISEVKVLQNNYSAEYTLMGNGVVMVQTKSGSDTFHGGGWEFLRNTVLDTRNYFVPVSTGISPEESNIFGWNLGGPLFVPKLYSPSPKKMFFYVNQQWVRQKQAGVTSGATASSDMRQGIFPAAGSGSKYLTSTNGGWLKDPSKSGTCNATNQAACFPNNQIPLARLDGNAVALLNAVAPLPNNQQNPTQVFNNYINTKPTVTDQMDVLAKLDINLTSKLRLTAEYMTQGNTSDSPSASRMGSPLANNYDVFDSNDQVAEVQLLQMYTSEMTNQTSISMSNMVEEHDIGGISHLSQVPNFKQVLPYTGGFLQDYLPFVSISGGWSSFGASSCCIIPRFTSLFDTVADNWSWLRGKHFLQSGMTMMFAHTRQWNTGSPLMDGSFTFSGNGVSTGNPMADYLLGYASSFSQGNTAFRRYMHYPLISPYVEDQWKATRRLTVTAGLRWFFLPWSDIQTASASSFVAPLFNPANAPSVQTNGQITPGPTYNPANGMVLNGENGIPQNFTAAHQYYLAPVAGFAWDVFGDGRSALRGGYGITYFKVTEDGCAQGCVNPPLLSSVSLSNVTFSDPVGASPPATAQGTTGVDLHNYRAAQIQNFSITLQQQMGPTWFYSIGGAGSVTTHEPIGTAGPIFPLGQPAPESGYDFNPLINPGTYNNAYFSPYPGYSSVGIYRSIFKGNWYALETSLQHPVGHGVYLKVAYTWSHNLDNLGGWINPYNIRTAYGNSTVNGNVPHLFTNSLIYSMPFFQNASGWKQVLLSGWKYSDMTTIQSGSSSSMGLSLAHSGLATRPNQTGPISYPKNWKAGTWFDTAPFAQPAAGYYGNVGNGTIRGPGLINFNMAAYKTFPIEERVKVQFRAEFFNVFNHTNPNGPNTSLGNGNFGKVTAANPSRVGQLSMNFSF